MVPRLAASLRLQGKGMAWERTEFITGVCIFLRCRPLRHVQARPQPLRVLVVRQRHGVRLPLEVIQAVKDCARWA